MDHAEAREVLEIAAVEPGGFERLIAGDTPEAAALAGHVAGCLDCATEMERLRRAANVIRDAVRTMPPPELRERTLAFVAAVGRDRSPGAVVSPPANAPTEIGARRSVGGSRRVALWAATLAAAIVVAVVGTSMYVTNQHDALVARQAETISALARVATWSLRIDGQADAIHVDLAGTGAGSGATGTLVFSSGTGELAVLASGLAQPPSGMEYRCWVEIGGSRRRVGQMFLGGDVAYWAGDVTGLSNVGEGARFGVSLVPSDGDLVTGDPILLGEL